jgi:hypothetical protein
MLANAIAGLNTRLQQNLSVLQDSLLGVMERQEAIGVLQDAVPAETTCASNSDLLHRSHVCMMLPDFASSSHAWPVRVGQPSCGSGTAVPEAVNSQGTRSHFVTTGDWRESGHQNATLFVAGC